jgi:hypothetical protein
MRTIRLTERDISSLVKKVLNEQEHENYMFFSNLEQMRRQCDILLNEFEPHMIDEILSGGHDWAADHISEAKNNMDQVFDFLMNEKSRVGNEGIEMGMMEEGRKKSGTKLCSRGLSAAKGKFKVHPSAYSNAYGVQVCQGKKPGMDGKKRCSPPYC